MAASVAAVVPIVSVRKRNKRRREGRRRKRGRREEGGGERGAPAAEGSLLLFTPLYVTCTAKPSKIRKRDVMKATVVHDSCATSSLFFFFCSVEVAH